MAQDDKKSQFKATLLCPATSDNSTAWAFVVLPKNVSDKPECDVKLRQESISVGRLPSVPWSYRLRPSNHAVLNPFLAALVKYPG